MNRRRLHGFLLIGACVLLAGMSLLLMHRERQVIFGVPVMSEQAYSALGEYAYRDLEAYLTQNGQIAAVDRKESVLYVSLDMERHGELWRTPVKLALHHPGYRLYFAPDDAFDDFAGAVQSGHRFTLIAAASTHHMRYQVVFTTLPVIRLDTQKGFGEYVHEGDVCLWSGYPSDEGYYTVSESAARWHKRGGSTRGAEKSSYKITFVKRTGETNNISVLDMGRDDDWILNAMPKDDLKLREKTITALWNANQTEKKNQIPMAPCRYVEAVIDGTYMGLYLLQRRMDNKLLGEAYKKDVIYKGDMNYGKDISVHVAFPIQYNPMQLPEQELYEYIQPFYDLLVTNKAKYDELPVDEENWQDLNVFCSVFALGDNRGSKNVFLIRHEEDGEPILQFVLWDTDMSMGLVWKDEDVRYKPNNGAKGKYLRREAESRFENDAQRYAAYINKYTVLRSSLLSQENIVKTILDCHREITEAGALQRDQEKWGLHNHGEDTLERLIEFIRIRTAWLDETYLQ